MKPIAFVALLALALCAAPSGAAEPGTEPGPGYPQPETTRPLEIDPSLWDVASDETGQPRDWIEDPVGEASRLVAPPVADTTREAL